MDNRTELETRNILDNNGNVVITISLPVGTTEDQWQTALTGYLIADSVGYALTLSQDEGILPLKKVRKISTRTKTKK